MRIVALVSAWSVCASLGVRVNKGSWQRPCNSNRDDWNSQNTSHVAASSPLLSRQEYLPRNRRSGISTPFKTFTSFLLAFRSPLVGWQVAIAHYPDNKLVGSQAITGSHSTHTFCNGLATQLELARCSHSPMGVAWWKGMSDWISGEIKREKAVKRCKRELRKMLRKQPRWDMFTEDFRVIDQNGAEMRGLGSTQRLWDFMYRAHQHYRGSDDVQVFDEEFDPDIRVRCQVQLGRNIPVVIEAEFRFHINEENKMSSARVSKCLVNGREFRSWPEVDLKDDHDKNLLKLKDWRHRVLLPLSTVQIVGDIYLDVIAKVDGLPMWDGDTSIKYPPETVAGGSALNTAVQLSALMRTRRQSKQAQPVTNCILHSRVGSDTYGDVVMKKIREANVAVSATQSGGQGICICLSGKRDRAFVSYKGSVGEFGLPDINMTSLLAPGTSHIHFSAYYDCSGLQAAVPELMKRAKTECGATISIVPQADPAGEYDSGFLELLPNVDVLICNEREAALIAGVPFAASRPSWSELRMSVQRLQEKGAQLVVITLGPEGAIASKADPSYWRYQPNRELPVIDATGCGDAFAAGFLFGWCNTQDVQRGLTYGCACGGAAVSQVGGSTPLDVKEVDFSMRRNEGVQKEGDFPAGLKQLEADEFDGLFRS